MVLTKVIIGTLIVTIIGIIVLKAIDPNLQGNSNTGGSGDSSIDIVDDDNISVGVSGEVVRPGNYTLALGSSMADLIEAAGGVTSNADEKCYFFEAIVEDSTSYNIAPLYEVDDVCGNNPIEKVNINDADEEELDSLDGIGEVMSSSIVQHREENGRFETLEDIMDVKGIGNSIFSKIKNNICLSD